MLESQHLNLEFISETLYIQNLNEKISDRWCPCSVTVIAPLLTSLSQSSKHLCAAFLKSYGEVLDVVAQQNNSKLRGQAFVFLSSADVAKKA